MPTYQYECLKCPHTFDASQSMRAEPLKICPVCKGELKRLIGTGGGILFKGSGFYQTDYRSATYQKKAKEDKLPTPSPPPPPAKGPGPSSTSGS